LQLCVPPVVMEFLKTNLKIETELFASPLNSSFPNFYSLFESDKFFGGKGNFYTLNEDTLLSGAYEINPPFIEEVFSTSADLVISSLKKASNQNEYLLFFYVIPWKDCQGYKKLVEEPNLVIAEIQLGEKNP